MLRPALPEDAQAVASVLIESRKHFLPTVPWAHTESEVRQWVQEHLVPGGGVTVCEQGTQIVAVLATSLEPGVAWIDQLYVLPGHTKTGIGTRLLRHAHQSLPRPIRLYTFQSNSVARRFYEKEGYICIQLSDGSNNEEKTPDALFEFGGAG